MSAPQTDPKTELRKSRWPLIGMALAVLVGVGAIAIWVFELVAEAPAPDERGAEEQALEPPAQEGMGAVPAPEAVEPREVEPDIISPPPPDE